MLGEFLGRGWNLGDRAKRLAITIRHGDGAGAVNADFVRSFRVEGKIYFAQHELIESLANRRMLKILVLILLHETVSVGDEKYEHVFVLTAGCGVRCALIVQPREPVA